MLSIYIQSALRQAHYDLLEDGTFYGEIEGFQGVYAHANTLEDCREQLQEVLEGWIVLGLRLGHSFPEVSGLRLEMKTEEV
jgi:predicted RNase H-like HicB family nuclease